MKNVLAALLFVAGLVAPVAALPLGGLPGPDGKRPPKPYFETILKDPAHPKVGVGVLYTPSFEFDGGVTDVALIFHRADPTDTLWPQQLLDLGFPPISWTLLEVGGGGNRETAFIHAGASVNLAPTVLGPLVKGLERAGGVPAKIGQLLVLPDGSGGVRFGVGWKVNAVRNGGVAPLNEWRAPPRYGVGYVYQFH